MSTFVKYLLTFIVGGIIGFCISYFCCQKTNVVTEYKTVRDTITITEERIVEHTVLKYTVDTLIKIDSVIVEKDGTYVSIPIEHKEYKDTIKFEDSIQAHVDIKYSGYSPSIDLLNVNLSGSREVITIKEPKKFGITWTIGPYIGFGFHGNVANPMTIGYGPSVGIGASIGFGGML